ncbi:asparagine synthase (glutamine-hydrolyzing) [Alkalilimnicola ehrlichii]|uniref:asparagine synthase (glutamine-hydrolyzing) n=1 Tax=Alkalilimnicola ehrlichii TaxID=351052 RepID=A0A3E0WH76_9GAMM|nr:asparagine synthase (glutamine-hydrolyzing) [Alkalilimnicola ehrlichii]RFA25164.1 asparagine synthase (glutamine-hydrolyzing) [Alkalilimnicola ehrlichii]RFA32118.1 asparagine synthase (glutamine-hydrolyzing) [Alkalilimnicola ehrlichii]
MCGIAGIFSFTGGKPAQPWELRAMASMVRHRGPDSIGFYRNRRVGLAHARLSIIDPTGGQQPLHSPDRGLSLICNGEIFNYRELRRDLLAWGYDFQTESDSEVILALYRRYGLDFVHRLNGQFALALWDVREERLVLARDRVGILPLFYSRQGERLLFGSEVKALLPLFDRTPRLNPVALDQLMTFWAPLAPETMFEGVHSLLPGHMLIVTRDETRLRAYWDWHFPDQGDWRGQSEAHLAEELREWLSDAVRLRLRADVSIGTYLSGGLDSSALTALAAAQSDDRLNSFSIGFGEGSGYDETPYQSMLAESLGTLHHTVVCQPTDIVSRFPEAIWHTEAPVLRTAPVPMCHLSARVRGTGCKAVLTGEGADEVLGGYDLFKEMKIRRFWARQRHSVWRPLLLRRLYPYLNLNGQRAPAYLEQFFGMGLARADSPLFSHLPRWITTARCKLFFSESLQAELTGGDALGGLQASLPQDWERWHSFNQAQYLEAKTLLSGYLLSAQGDRMLMANAVEGRFPFLDHRLIDFAAGVSPHLKMKVLNEKYLLKRAVADLVPADICRRPKQPYRAPDGPAFFAGDEADYVRELLSEETLQRYGYFDARRVMHLLSKARQGRAIGAKDNMALVGILSTQLWHCLFIENFQQRFSGAGHDSRNHLDTGETDVDNRKDQTAYSGELLVHRRSGGLGG